MTANSAVPATFAVISTSPRGAGRRARLTTLPAPARGAPPARRRRTRRRRVPATPSPSRPASPGRRAAPRTPRRPRGDRRGGRTTSPVTPSVDRLGRAARLAGDLRHPARRGLDEHDAEALLLEPAPPGAARHGEDVAAPVQRRQAVVGDPPEEAHRCVALGGEPAQAPLVAAAAGDRQHEVGSPRRQQGGRLDGDVEALAWDQPRDRHDQLAVGGQTELAAGGEPVVGVERDEAVGVDARRHDGHGQLALGGALRPRCAA